MAFTFLLKRSAVAGHAPVAANLAIGEMSINTNDGILYYLKNTAGSNTVVAIGPVPATANALTTSRTLSLSGDATGSIGFDGSANVSIPATLAASGVAAGTYNSVVVNTKGLVTGASTVAVLTTLVASGDASGTSVANAITLTLATVNANVGVFNTLTVNAKGLVTAASNTPYLTNVVASGDATGTSASNALTLTLASVNAGIGSFGGITTVPVMTVNAKGLITAIANTAITFPVTTVFGRAGTVVLLGSDVTTALGYTPVNNAVLGVANGVATLDGTGHLTTAQLPSSVVGGMTYQSTWNSLTNTPALVTSTGTKGFFYKVSVASNAVTTLDGISNWNVGDSVVFDGTTWDKIDGVANEVLSVAGRTGVITLAVADVTGAAPLAAPAFTGNATSTTPISADSSTSIATTAFVKGLNYTVGPIVATGDATGTAVGNSIALTLASVATLGTFASVVINAKGLVTSGVAAIYSGDATGTSVGPNTVLTLATVNAGVGSFGGVTTVPVITANAKGLITAIANTAITFPVTTVFGRAGAVVMLGSDVTTALGYTPVNNAVLGVANGVATLDSTTHIPVAQLPANTLYSPLVATGDAAGTSVANAITLTLAAAGTTGTYSSVTTDTKGRVISGGNIVASGDATGTVAGTALALTLAAVGTAGTYTSLVTDSKGRVTSGSNMAATGDATGTAIGSSIALTLASVNAGSVGTFAGIVVNAKGLVTGATALTTLAGYGIVSDTIDGGSF